MCTLPVFGATGAQGAPVVAARRTGLRLLVFSTKGHTPRRFGSSPVVDTNALMAEMVLASGVRAVVLAPTVYLENLPLATLAVAALDRPELAGRVYEIATPGAVTAPSWPRCSRPGPALARKSVAATDDCERRIREVMITAERCRGRASLTCPRSPDNKRREACGEVDLRS